MQQLCEQVFILFCFISLRCLQYLSSPTQINLDRLLHILCAGKVTAGLARSNGILQEITCRLTAYKAYCSGPKARIEYKTALLFSGAVCSVKFEPLILNEVSY